MLGLPGLPTTAIDLGNPVNQSSPLNRGLISWWLSLPGSAARGGNRFIDLCGRNHGTLTAGPVWAASRPGGWGSLSLDGTDDYLAINDLSLTDFTFSLWFAKTGTGTKGILGRTDSTGAIYFLNDLEFRCNYAGNDDFLVPSVGLNIWHHFSFTRIGTFGRVYLDGVESSSGAINVGTTTQTPNAIGRTSTTFAGMKFDDVRLHNRGLSGSEVVELYQESLRGNTTTLNRVRLPVIFAGLDGAGGTEPIVASDTLDLSLTEAVALLIALAPVDTLDLSITETATIATVLSAVDTLSLSMTDAALVAVTLDTVDTLSLTLLDEATVAVTLALVDTLGLSLSEALAIVASLTATDTLTLSLAELADIAVVVTAFDTLSLSIVDAASVNASLLQVGTYWACAAELYSAGAEAMQLDCNC